jgi:tryptophan synthase alpha chain
VVKPLIRRLKSITQTPICVGFGISTPEQAGEVAAAGADGVIIGSRIVKVIEQNIGSIESAKGELKRFLAEVRATLL